MATLKHIIVDKNGGGWATEDPIEGWIFTRLRTDAATFDIEGDAQDAICNYPEAMRSQLLVSQMIVDDQEEGNATSFGISRVHDCDF